MFHLSGDRQQKRMLFSAELHNIDLADRETRRLLEENNLNDLSFPVLLCMREALANAVIHGSSKIPSREIRYAIRLSDGVLTMEVEDQGSGFDWKNRPLTMPAPEATGGRGLAIMEQYFSDIRFNDRGNQIILTMVLPRGSSMSSIQRDGDSAVITPGKDIVASMADEFREELKTLVQNGVTHLQIDLRDVAMMDSIGMGLLIAAHNSLKNNGGELSVIHASNDILGLFKTMRLDKHFEIVND